MNKQRAISVLQINTTANWGSTGRIAEEIGQLVVSQGSGSYIAYGRGNPKSKSKLIHIGNDLDMKCHALQSRLFGNHGLASKQVTRIFIKQIDSIKPDMVHLHNIHGYYLNYEILFDYLAQLDIPIVWTLHDCWAFTGHCAYYSYVGCNRWRTLCHDCPQKKSYPSSWFADRSEQNFRDKLHAFTSVRNMTLVPVSAWLAEEVRLSFLKDYPIQVIHNGIDTDVFSPKQICKSNLGLKDKFMILGVASVWETRKGLDDFIKLRKLLSDDYSIVLIGLDEKQIKQLPKGIIGIRRTNSIQDLVAYYSVADAYFNPTWEDNFPTTNLESLSCGTSVITYHTGGSVEAVDERTGFVVEQGNIAEVANIVEFIKEMGKEHWTFVCRERARNLYDKKERYMEYLHLYEKVVSL